MVLFDMHMMSCDGFQAAGKIRDRGCGRAALPVEKEAKSTFEGVNLDEMKASISMRSFRQVSIAGSWPIRTSAEAKERICHSR